MTIVQLELPDSLEQKMYDAGFITSGLHGMRFTDEFMRLIECNLPSMPSKEHSKNSIAEVHHTSEPQKIKSVQDVAGMLKK